MEAQPILITDLETVDCYMVVCTECKTATSAMESEYDAMAHATESGFRVFDDSVYCEECIDLAIQRDEEEAEDSRPARAREVR